MKIITLTEWDIDSLVEQGAEIELTFIYNEGLPLDFNRGWSGYDSYEVIIDRKYKGSYHRRYKRNFNNNKIFLDKIQF